MTYVGIALGALMVLAGGLWTGDGLGWFGEPSGSSFAPVLGPLLAGFGVALLWVLVTRRV